jgi:hypothetical protein
MVAGPGGGQRLPRRLWNAGAFRVRGERGHPGGVAAAGQPANIVQASVVRRRPAAAKSRHITRLSRCKRSGRSWFPRRRVSLRLLLQTTFPASPRTRERFLARTRPLETRLELRLPQNPGSEKRLAIRGRWVCSRDLPPPAPTGAGETLTKQKLLLRILLNSRQLSSLGCRQGRRFCQKFRGIAFVWHCWRRVGRDRSRLHRQEFGTPAVKIHYPLQPADMLQSHHPGSRSTSIRLIRRPDSRANGSQRT